MNPRAGKSNVKPIVVLASGRGSNLEALSATAGAERWESELGAKIAAVISNRADAEAISVARSKHLPVHILAHEEFGSRAAFDDALSRTLDRYTPELIILAGFMRVLTPPFVRRYARRLINVHPSLLPSFPGLNTHQRALDAGVRVHGATVHFVSEDVDAGPIISQAVVAVHADDDAASLAARVLQQEHRLLPQAVRYVLEVPRECREQRAVLSGIRQGELALLASMKAASKHVKREGRKRSASDRFEPRRSNSERGAARNQLEPGRKSAPRRTSRDGDGANASTSRITSLVVDSLAAAFAVILKFDGPSDVLLSRFFRLHPSLGQRDRGLIAEAVFFALRRYATLGWMMQPAHPMRAPRFAAETLARQHGLDAIDQRALRGDANAVGRRWRSISRRRRSRCRLSCRIGCLRKSNVSTTMHPR